jgi:hypothetical protein
MEFFKFLDDLIKPGNWPFLVVFAIVLAGAAAVLVFLILATIRKENLDVSQQIGPLWIHLRGGKDDPKTEKRLYRKLLYVKVNYLANRKEQGAPFYTRTVDRLDPEDRMVPVFDEAVYYTLKLYPEQRQLGLEQDQSSGVVDARLVIPWLTSLEFHNEGAKFVKQMVNMETSAPSDTMLSVSHFLNGLQDRNQQFCTYADEDAESLRIVVDFSSIPDAANRVALDRVQLMVRDQAVETDDMKYQQCGPSVYMAHCRNAKKGSLLKMDFTFRNWEPAQPR